MAEPTEGRKFLGRDLDPRTMTYSFGDGTGRVPEEMRQDVLSAVEMRFPAGGNAFFVLAKIWAWKDKLKKAGWP